MDWPSAFCTGEKEQTQGIIQRLDSNCRMVAAVARAYGTVPVFVYQPVSSYAYDNSRRVFPVRDSKSTPWMQAKRGYEIFREMRTKGEAFNENVL